MPWAKRLPAIADWGVVFRAEHGLTMQCASPLPPIARSRAEFLQAAQHLFQIHANRKEFLDLASDVGAGSSGADAGSTGAAAGADASGDDVGSTGAAAGAGSSGAGAGSTGAAAGAGSSGAGAGSSGGDGSAARCAGEGALAARRSRGSAPGAVPPPMTPPDALAMAPRSPTVPPPAAMAPGSPTVPPPAAMMRDARPSGSGPTLVQELLWETEPALPPSIGSVHSSSESASRRRSRGSIESSEPAARHSTSEPASRRRSRGSVESSEPAARRRRSRSASRGPSRSASRGPGEDVRAPPSWPGVASEQWIGSREYLHQLFHSNDFESAYDYMEAHPEVPPSDVEMNPIPEPPAPAPPPSHPVRQPQCPRLSNAGTRRRWLSARIPAGRTPGPRRRGSFIGIRSFVLIIMKTCGGHRFATRSLAPRGGRHGAVPGLAPAGARVAHEVGGGADPL